VGAAIACIRREGPGVSMERIAAEAGVTKPILYRHFRHRADLENAIATRFTDAIGTQLRRVMRRTGDPRLVLESAIDSYVRLVERDTDVYRFLVHRGRPSVSAEGAIEHFMRRLGGDIGLVLGERMRELGLDSGPAELWGHGIVGMVGASVDWWVDRNVLPRRRLVQFLAELLWRGLGGATRPARASSDVEAFVADRISRAGDVEHLTASADPGDPEESHVADVIPIRRSRS
jgi:AcrR family transcriptional regulator